MNLRNFLTGNGEVYLENKFLSARAVKDVLGKNFKVRVIDEAPDYVKCKIIRFARLYGAPFIWPQASIEVWIDNKHDKLIYKFHWPEYLALAVTSVLLFIIEERVRDVIVFLIFALIFFCGLMFLDTRWVSIRVRKAFQKI